MDAREMKEMFGDRVAQLIGSRLEKWDPRRMKGCCPIHSDKTPSFSYDKANLRFKCFSCQATMDVYDYYEHFEGMTFQESKEALARELGVEVTKINGNINPGRSSNMNPPIEKKPEFNLKSKTGREYAMPVLEEKRASVELVEYLDTRGISEKTIAHFGVTGNSTRMFFNIRDESGTLCNIKARNIGDFDDNSKRGFSQTKSAKQALFGMHLIKDFDQLYITEGEIDAMSLFECGFTNVVSIPAGSSNMGWIETNWEYLQKFTGFVIWGDMDEAGEKFRRETCKRLGEDMCQYVEYDIGSQKQFKDANGILKLKGIKAIQAVLSERVRMYPIEGGIFMSDIPTINDQDYSQNVPTGIWGIDHVLIDPRLGQTILVSGREGTGKSTLLSQISLNAVAAGWKTMMYSGEMPAHRVKQWLFNQAAQNHRFVTVTELKYGRQSHYPRSDMVPYIEKWLNNGFVLFDNSQLSTDNPPKILDILERFVTRYGVKVLIIDNLLTSDFRRYGPSGS
jgi:DNA primase